MPKQKQPRDLRPRRFWRHVDRFLRLWWKIYFGFVGLNIVADIIATIAQSPNGPASLGQYFTKYSYILYLIHTHPRLFWGVFGVCTAMALAGLALNVIDWWKARRQKDVHKAHYLQAVEEMFRLIPVVFDDDPDDPDRALPEKVYQNLEYQDDPTWSANELEASRRRMGAKIRKVETIVDLWAASKTREVVIVGSPGTGKTTFLRRSMRALAARARKNQEFVPVYVALPRFAPLLAEDPKTAIARYLRKSASGLTATGEHEHANALRDYADDLQNLVQAGRALLFLDGWDEVLAGQRDAVQRWIGELEMERRGAVAIGTRFAEYTRGMFGQYAEWVTLPIDEEIQRNLAVELLDALYLRKKRELPPGERNTLKEPDPAAFIAALSGHEHAKDWGGNPLLFTLAVFVYFHNNGRLPASRVALYTESIGALLKKVVRQAQAAHAEANEMGLLDTIRRALAEVALWLFASQAQDERKADGRAEQSESESANASDDAATFTKQELIQIVLPQITSELHLPIYPSGEMSEWITRSGTVRVVASVPGTPPTARIEQVFAFRHHTFQEYLTAVALAHRLTSGDQAVRDTAWTLIRDQRLAEFWSEPMRMLAGELMEESSSPRSPGKALAISWLSELMDLAAPTSERPNDDALILAVASLTEIPDVKALEPDIDVAGILQAWAEALLRTARQGPAGEAMLARLQRLASDILPLAQFAQPAVDMLIHATEEDRQPESQAAAARALGGLGNLVPVAPLQRLLFAAPDPAVRLAGAIALARLKHDRDRPGLAVLGEGLRGTDVSMRRIIANALRYGDEHVLPLIRQAMNDGDAEVRGAGVRALGAVGASVSRQTLVLLTQALGDADQGVRIAALEVLGQFGKGISDVTIIEALKEVKEPLLSEAAQSLLQSLDSGGQRKRALGLARDLTARPDVGWQLWRARAQLEDTLPAALEALAMMGQLKADPEEIEYTWQDLIPLSLRQLSFAGRWIKDERRWVAVIVPPVCDVPAGTFLMGSDKQQDHEASGDEQPLHSVTLGAFQIGTYPVTVAEYACAVRAQAVREPSGWAGQLQKLDHPVVNVSWQDALAYARWLAQVTGQPWRLPTEAEWEKAARGADGRIYPWGNQWDKTRANTTDGGPGTTTPVGAYAERGDASPYGAHDLAGNVWEWCSTLYQSYPYSASDRRENLDSTGNRVLRGGSWYDNPRLARAAFRNYDELDDFSYYVGFRLASGVAGSS